jgi:hypothetical protein
MQALARCWHCAFGLLSFQNYEPNKLVTFVNYPAYSILLQQHKMDQVKHLIPIHSISSLIYFFTLSNFALVPNTLYKPLSHWSFFQSSTSWQHFSYPTPLRNSLLTCSTFFMVPFVLIWLHSFPIWMQTFHKNPEFLYSFYLTNGFQIFKHCAAYFVFLWLEP